MDHRRSPRLLHPSPAKNGAAMRRPGQADIGRSIRERQAATSLKNSAPSATPQLARTHRPCRASRGRASFFVLDFI